MLKEARESYVHKFDSPLAAWVYQHYGPQDCDEDASNADFGGWVGRIGRRILVEDSRGFVSLGRWDDEDSAHQAFVLMATDMGCDGFAEPTQCDYCGQDVEPEWAEEHRCFSGWTGPLVGRIVEIKGYLGVAQKVYHHSVDRNEIIAIMVGDDTERQYSTPDIARVLEREDYCGECGQVGCTQDGLPRSE